MSLSVEQVGRRAVGACILTVLAGTMPQPGLLGQSIIDVPDPGLGVPLVEFHSLGPVLDSTGAAKVFPGPPTSAVALRDGSLLLSVTAIGAPIYRVNVEGRMIGTVPIRFKSIVRIAALKGDSIAVWDQGSNSLLVLDPHFKEVRRGRIPFSAANSLVSPDGTHIVNQAYVLTPAFAGMPFHLFDTKGRYLKSFGQMGSFRANRNGAVQPRPLAASSLGIVAGRVDHYEIESWSLSGELRYTLTRTASWFPGRPVSVPRRGEAPPTLFSAIHEDANGLISTAVLVPAKDLPKFQGGKAGDPLPIEDWGDLWDTRVECLDMTRHEVVAAGRIHGTAVLFVGDHTIIGRRPVPGGWTVVLWSFSLPDVSSTGGPS